MGDVVRLNSGSPNLTIVKINDDLTQVAWYNEKTRTTEGATLPMACLTGGAAGDRKTGSGSGFWN